MTPHVYIERIDNEYLESVRKGLSFIEFGRCVSADDEVFIKPNLTLPEYRRGVMTNPKCIEQVIIAVKDYVKRITIGESDGGGYTRFMMDEVFRKIGMYNIAKRYGVKVANLSRLPTKQMSFWHNGKNLRVPLPRVLLEEIALLLTLPVPKVHMHTQVSLSIKNQWGCIPDPLVRLKMHPFFEKIIMEVNKVCRAKISIVDGMYGLSGCGPLRGESIHLDWVLLSNNIALADVVCCHLMGVNPGSIPHLQFFLQHTHDIQPLRFSANVDWGQFVGPQFLLRIPPYEYPGHAVFRSPFLTWLAYFSPLASLLHNAKYLFTEKYY